MIENTFVDPPYPKQIFFILISLIFVYSGHMLIENFFIIFIFDFHHYEMKRSSPFILTFDALLHAAPVLGAFLDNNWFGKYRTMIGFLTVGSFCGTILTTTASITPDYASKVYGLLGLALIAIGLGGMNPCLWALTGDQFVDVPQQQEQLRNCLYIYYFSLYTIIMICRFLWNQIGDFGRSNLPLGFGIAALLIAVGIAVMLAIKKLVKRLPPKQNVIVDSFRCIFNAITKKIKSDEKQPHWLDYSIVDYGSGLVRDIKDVLNIIVIFMPFTLHQVIRALRLRDWQKQALFMDDMRSTNCNFVSSEKMFLAESVFRLISMSILGCIVFPLFAKFNIKVTLLKYIGLGGTLIATSLLISGCVNYYVEQDKIIDFPKEQQSYMRIINKFNCSVRLNMTPYINDLKIETLGYKFVKIMNIKEIIQTEYEIKTCLNSTLRGKILIKEKQDYVYLVNSFGLEPIFSMPPHKHSMGFAQGFIANWNISSLKLTRCEKIIPPSQSIFYKTGKYKISHFHKEISIHRGAFYIIVIDFSSQNEIKDIVCHEIRPPHRLNALWQVPQYMFYACGLSLLEPLLIVFGYTQAPMSMKSLMIAIWTTITFFGNSLNVILEQLDVFGENKTVEYFLIGSLALIFMGVFAFLVVRYKYVELRPPDDQDD